MNAIKRKMHETGIKCTFSVGLSKENDVSSPNSKIRKKGIAYIRKLLILLQSWKSDAICGILYAATPATGHIPWRDILKAPKEIGYDRWVVVEARVHDVFMTELGEMPPKIAMWRRLHLTEMLLLKKL